MGKTQLRLRSFVVKNGRAKTVLLITVLSVLLSLLITGLISLALGDANRVTAAGWLAAVLAPVLIAPLMSTYFLSLLVEIDRLEVEMRALATYDGLTGALNRRAFLSGAEMLGRLSTRLKHQMAVLMLDLDHFKRINDTHGHLAGDEVLKALWLVMRDSVRSSDLVGRIGGEEFAICLPDTGAEEAMQLAERLLINIRAAVVTVGGVGIRFTASIGVAVSDPTNDERQRIAHLLWLADTALYAAKRNGRDRACAAIDPVGQ